MGMDKLAGLYLPQQFLRISAHIAGSYFIAYDLALGIDNESAALSKPVGSISTSKSLEMAWVGSACMG